MTEIDRLRRELGRTQARLGEVERMADQDALVPLNNRRAFMREMSRVLHFAGRYGSQASLIYLDLNGLKQINDTLGHAAGDAAISKVAELLKHSVRDFDVVGRLGGDEFAVVLAQTPLDQARDRAEQLAGTIRATTIPWHEHLIKLDTAYGVYPLEVDADPAAALAAADRAMYAQKQRMKQARGADASATVVPRRSG
jgi:diguanylate cyclase (GGDEF)-like protein